MVGRSRADFFLFRHLASNPQSGLVADQPFKAVRDGRMLIPLGRRLVSADGKFTMTNGRNGFTKTYTARAGS
jgi:hypothetical protein